MPSEQFPKQMEPFWDRVNSLLEKHNVLEETSEGEVSKLIIDGYLEIKAHGITYRSVPCGEHGEVAWISWEPYEIIPHFSMLTDPHATIRWVSHRARA